MARLRIYLYTSVLIFMHTLVAPLGRLFSLDLSHFCLCIDPLLSFRSNTNHHHREIEILNKKKRKKRKRDNNTSLRCYGFMNTITDLPVSPISPRHYSYYTFPRLITRFRAWLASIFITFLSTRRGFVH